MLGYFLKQKAFPWFLQVAKEQRPPGPKHTALLRGKGDGLGLQV